MSAPRPGAGVCLATTSIGPGGVWTHLLALADGLRKAGVAVRFDLPTQATTLRRQAEQQGYATGAEPFAHEVFHAHLGNTYDLALTRRLPRLRAQGARIVLTEHLPRTDASDPSLAARRPRPGATAAKTVLKRAQYVLADRVIAVSQGSAAFLRDRYGAAHKVVVVPNGLDASAPATPLPPPGDVVRYVAVGNVIVQKGYDLLVEAARLADVEWLVDVWGEGAHRADLNRAASQIRLGDGRPRVRFHGWTDDACVELAAAHAAVMPSRWESFAYSALEAMSLGRPVVATRVDGLSEVVEDGVSGVLVPPEPVALAAALDALAVDPGLRQRMGTAGALRARTVFTREAMVAGTLDVYRSCLGSRLTTGERVS